MKRLILILFCVVLIPAFSGCANGPMSRWFRGDKCDTCNPPSPQPVMYSPCGSGGCNAPPPNYQGQMTQNQPMIGSGYGTQPVDQYGIVPPAGSMNPGPSN